ncbi:MAG: hypothetical protein M3Z22_07985 [Verrucomicrobiota bacterium]|nr:hypothetical protein [Verrucomicrobiota bacterium]
MSESQPAVDGGPIRQTTVSRSQEHRRESYELEDKRWARRAQTFDWLILAVFILIDVGVAMLLFFFEPGLR